MDIQTMKSTDLAQVLEIQRLCYPSSYHEPRSAFENKLRWAPQTSWIATCGDANPGGRTQAPMACAYLVALPVDESHFPQLHAHDWTPPSRARWLCIHDLAVHPDHRGSGAAGHLIDHAATQARQAGLAGLALVAVEGAEAYWARQGFEAVQVDHKGLRDRLASFGDTAKFMIRLNPARR